MSRTKPNANLPISRRDLLRTGTIVAAGLATSSLGARAQGGPVNIRFATGGGIGPNEITTCVWLDYLKENVLKNYGKAYTLDITFTRGSICLDLRHMRSSRCVPRIKLVPEMPRASGSRKMMEITSWEVPSREIDDADCAPKSWTSAVPTAIADGRKSELTTPSWS